MFAKAKKENCKVLIFNFKSIQNKNNFNIKKSRLKKNSFKIYVRGIRKKEKKIDEGEKVNQV